MMAQQGRLDTDTVRELERRIASQQRRIEQLERIEHRRTIDPVLTYEWRCTHCEDGWIVHDHDELRCTNCNYLRYL
jgi:hypothetical protein